MKTSYKIFILMALPAASICNTGCSSAPQKPQAYTIEIKNMKFVPDSIVVNKGDTVKWVNEDMVAHDATEEVSGAWSSGKMAPNTTWKLIVTDSADYYCSIHMTMKGKIRLAK
jgi:plastocyanin